MIRPRCLVGGSQLMMSDQKVTATHQTSYQQVRSLRAPAISGQAADEG
jgi:hypothetical protein